MRLEVGLIGVKMRKNWSRSISAGDRVSLLLLLLLQPTAPLTESIIARRGGAFSSNQFCSKIGVPLLLCSKIDFSTFLALECHFDKLHGW
jgi:hypothetical protein